ncbi:MarR family transcriptional regulator [Natronomonas sp. LN261]|uniref:MarR family transcriptional regulator n=1 Tax=Natronomonas sp. LN261 TaxID=2750669 RepID=UPI0015EFBBE5|nr:MarR family transcriptional regulator [Natronomonas sp. LN261]
MSDGRHDREVSDERVLLEFLLTSDPALFTSELSENLPITRQRVGQLLNELEQDGLVTSKKASGRRLWWLTTSGKEYIAGIARERLA